MRVGEVVAPKHVWHLELTVWENKLYVIKVADLWANVGGSTMEILGLIP